YRISKTYGISQQELAEINSILEAGEIQPGQRIFVPGAKQQKYVYVPGRTPPSGAPSVKTARKPAGNEAPEEKDPVNIKTYRGDFIWPVAGKVTSNFGMRSGNMHDGIDVSTKKGTPVY